MIAPDGRNLLHIDIETYSPADIGKCGLHKYVEAEGFQILLFAYSLNGGAVEIVDLASGEKLPGYLLDMLQAERTVKLAYNAVFEWTCINAYFRRTMPRCWHGSPIGQWRCTMLHGCYCGYPAGLAAIGGALGLPEDKKKLATGKALIKLFCTPHGGKQQSALWDTTRVPPEQEPEKWRLFKEYCKQDVVTELEVEKRLSAWPVPDKVQKEWELDAITNARGVRVDGELVDGALVCVARVSENLAAEAKKLTGLQNPNSPAQLSGWLQGKLGRAIPDMTKATVAEFLQDGTIPGDVRRVLEIRQEQAKTSVKKYGAMREAVSSGGRVRGLLQFYGARTGRWAGRLVQVQNLPRNYLASLDAARELAKRQKLDALRLIYGNVPDTLSQLIRTAFVPSEGNTLVVADFSAIEARVISWLAGETWRLEAFRAGKDIYCESASQMFGVPVEKHGRNAHLRQKGKIAELALGYQGGVGALKAMGADKMGLSDDELLDIVARWREANPAIVSLWRDMEDMARYALERNRPCTTRGRGVCFALVKATEGLSALAVSLPSGRELFYPNPRIGANKKGFDAILFDGLNVTNKWGALETYGGKLTENIVQAIARDCLAEALARLAAAGYETVMHIHDEAVLDVPRERASLDDVIRIMTEPIPWAPGLPLAADGFAGPYYKKD